MLICYGGQTISYDAQGNPLNYLGHTLSWEKGRQLKSFDSNTYTYNANGIRTSKTVGGIKHEYILDGAKILREEWNGNTIVPIYDNEEIVCGIIYNGEPYYFHKNLQGDIIAIVNKDAEIVARYTYDAWGVPTITQDSSGCGIATINPYRYRGYYYDQEIGMYYLQSRYYNPQVGRFVNGDEVTIATLPYENLTSNLFSYCCNDAINTSDTSGYLSISLSRYRSVSWLARFMSKCVSVVTEREKVISKRNISWLGVKFALSAVAGTSMNSKSLFKLTNNGKSYSFSIGGISFSNKGNFTLSTSFTLFSTSVGAFVTLSRRDLTFGITVFHNVKQNGKKVYYGMKIAISISYVTLAAMAAIGIILAVVLPALSPVITKVFSVLASFVSSPYGLTAGSAAVVTVMRAFA